MDPVVINDRFKKLEKRLSSVEKKLELLLKRESPQESERGSSSTSLVLPQEKIDAIAVAIYRKVKTEITEDVVNEVHAHIAPEMRRLRDAVDFATEDTDQMLRDYRMDVVTAGRGGRFAIEDQTKSLKETLFMWHE